MYFKIKRFFDVAVAIVAITLFSPLLLLIFFLILACDGRPVIFSQVRVGKDQAKFKVFKFRTMSNNARFIRDGLQVKINDTRITRFGRYLRQSSLDELPQIFNILRGDISIVGPRACLPEQVQFFSEKQRERFLIVPGLTGLAVVRGRASIPWSRRLRWDRIYVSRKSLLLDIYIIYKTFHVVVSGSNVYYNLEKYGPAFDLVDPGNLPQSTERQSAK